MTTEPYLRFITNPVGGRAFIIENDAAAAGAASSFCFAVIDTCSRVIHCHSEHEETKNSNNKKELNAAAAANLLLKKHV